ncbi:MAG: hypothetical protein WCF18_23195 [Chthoniobacteraceae bacterium]
MAEKDPTQKEIAGNYARNFDYPKRPHYLRRIRGWCFAAAVVISIVGALTYSYWGTQRAFNTGPISENHARFANDCRACHLEAETDFFKSLLQPASAGLPTAAPAPIVRSSDAAKLLYRTSISLMDQACLQCHPTQGLHLPQATGLALRTISSELNVVHATSCAVCHREHIGPQRMALPERQTCGTCHDHVEELRRTRRSLKLKPATIAATGENRDLGDGLLRFIAAPRPVGTLPAFASYADGHPPFGYEQPGMRDPADLKFNHARHLRSDIPAGKEGRLDCATCHQRGPGGAFYQPVRYQKHCQECHSLQISPTLPQLRVPHGDPEKVRYFLASLGTSTEAALRAEGLSDPVEISRRIEAENQALRRRGLASLSDLERRVFLEGDPRDDGTTRLMRAGNPKFLTECAKCHTVTPGAAGQLPVLNRPRIAERWVQRGPFTHLPHEHMACADCHGAATKSKLTSDILLPAQALCAECHRPPENHTPQPWESVTTSAALSAPTPALAAAQRSAGGVKWDCQGCHIFHAPPDATRVTQSLPAIVK